MKKKNTRQKKPKDTLAIPSDVKELLDSLSEIPPAIEEHGVRFIATYGQKFKGYVAEEIKRQQEILSAGKHAELEKEFAQDGVDYHKEIFPIFQKGLWEFISRWASRKARREALSAHQKWLRLRDGAVRLITADEEPYSKELKEKLKEEHDRLVRLKLEDFEAYRVQEIKILGRDVKRASQKYPIWRELGVQLYEIIHQGRVTEWRTFRLIEKLFKTLTPHWHRTTDVDTILHNVRRRLKEKSRP